MNSISRQKSTIHRVRKSSSASSIAIIFLIRKSFDILSIYLKNRSYFFVSMLNSISNVSKFCIKRHCIKNIKNHLKRFFLAININIIWIVWEHFKITSVCLANRFWFSVSAMISMFQHIDIFYSKLTFDDSNAKLFNEVEDFLQHFQQCQNQYSKSDMFEWLSTCLKRFALEWFNDQSKFIFLHEFDIALTNAFFFKQNNSSFLSIFASKSTYEIFENSTNFILIVSTVSSKEQQKLKISTSNRCQWCQLNYEIYIIHRFQYFSCVARTQQTYEFVLQFFEKNACEIFENSIVFVLIFSFVSQKQQKSNALKIAKKTKFNAIKNVKRVKSKTLKTKKVAKSTSTFQDIDIFDSTFTCEDRKFSEFAKFLQHFQQCQHLYRKSNLLLLLFTCLWNSIFDIWYDKQNIMKSTFLSEWIEILRVDFVDVSFAKLVNCSKIICMRCEKNFNFKDEFRNHVRNQYAKKSINRFDFMINTVKSACQVVEKSTNICLLVLQKSFVFFATSRKHVSKFEIVFETIISSTNSILSIATINNVLQSMKNKSIQCFFASWISFSMQNQKILVLKFEIFNQIFKSTLIFESVISSECLNFSFFTFEYISESTESASIQRFSDSSELQISIATSTHIFESTLIFKTVISSKNSYFTSSAFETISKLMKNTLI